MREFGFVAFLIVSISCFYSPVFGQELSTEEFLSLNSDADVVAHQEFITYNFDVNGNNLEVLENTVSSIENLNGLYEFAKVEFFDSQSEVVKYAVTDPERKKKVKTKAITGLYQVEEYFYSDASVFQLPVSFSKSGEKRDIETQKRYKDIRYFTRVGFHEYYPVKNKTLTFQIPSTVNIDIIEFNFEGNDVEKKITKPSDQMTEISYTMRDVNMFLGENASYGMPRNFPHLLIVPKSFTNDKGEEQKIFDSTKELYQWYKSITNLVQNDATEISPIVTQITQSHSSDLDKIKALYYWVQDNIRYIAFEDGIAGFKPDEAQNVYNKKYGDCKGMANLLKTMLIEAGYDARLTWVGTNRLPYSYSTPSLGVDNHMITSLFYDGKTYYLDPTEKFNSFGEYAFRIQGKEVLIEDSDNYIVQKVPVKSSLDNQEIITKKYTLSEDLKLSGKARHQYFGESRTYLLYVLNSIQQNNIDEAITYFLTNQDKNIATSDLEISSIKNRDEVFEMSYDLVIDNHVSAFGSEIYIEPEYDQELFNMLMEDTRQTDYVFPHKLQQKKEISIHVPDHLQIQSLPKTVQENHPNYSFNASYILDGQNITYTKEIVVKNGIILKEDFDSWNTSIKNLKTFYDEQIVLKKTN